MGLDVRTAEFLRHCRARTVDFSDTLTLGRQSVRLSAREAAALHDETGVDLSGAEFADAFFRHLGAHRLDAMDASAYEGASIIFNLNAEIGPELRNRFSVVIDGGTLEHVFHFPAALANCMRMVRPGGHFISCTAANNLMGHGFYQFSPELFWRALAPVHGFTVEAMLIHERGAWYSVADPAAVRGRVEAITADETTLFVCALKTADVPPFDTPPHQSDYAANLASTDSTPMDAAPRGWKDRLAGALPLLRSLQENWRAYKFRRTRSLGNAGIFQRLGPRLHPLAR